LLPFRPAVDQYEAQLLLAPRRDGAITIGDTHAFDAPGAFGSDDEAHEYLEREAAAAFGRRCRQSRGAGRVPTCGAATGSTGFWREEIRPGVVAVAGTGGMGVTGSQHWRLETLDVLDL